MQKLLFITSNKNKVAIANEVLRKYCINLKAQKFDIKEIQSTDIDRVAIEKAVQASNKTNRRFIVDDSGIYIKALRDFPGALLKEIDKSIGPRGLIKLMSKERNRKAVFVNVLVYCDPVRGTKKIFRTIINGKIAYKATGNRKTGWAIETIFIPQGTRKTIAQFNNQEWEGFWRDFKLQLHYNKFGKWFSSYSKL